MVKQMRLIIIAAIFTIGLLSLAGGGASAHPSNLQTERATVASASAPRSANSAPTDKLMSYPNAYGGVDRNVVTGPETWPYVTQNDTTIEVSGDNTLLIGYEDSRGSNQSPTNLAGASSSSDGGATWTRYTDPISGQGPFTGTVSAFRADPGAGGGGLSDRAPMQPPHADGYGWSSSCPPPPAGEAYFYWFAPGGYWAITCMFPSGAYGLAYGGWDNNALSTFSGTQYLGTNSSGGGIGVTHTTDNGVTWTAQVTVTTAVQSMSDMTIGLNGTVFIAALAEGGGGLNPRTNYLYRSTDGGVTWGSAIAMGSSFPAPGVGTDGSYATMFPGAWRYQGQGQLGVSPNGTVHYTYTQHGAGSDPGNIEYIRSTDGGITWSVPVQVNTDTGTATQWQPSLAATSNGALYIGWYDTRNGGQCTVGVNTPCYERLGRVSLDGGLTWQTDQAVSDVVSPLPAQPDPNLPASYAGDTVHAYASGTDVLEAWVDGRVLINSQSQQDIFFDKIALGQNQGTPTATPMATATACTITFTDVDPSSAFYTYIRCLACRGIISGYADGTFKPGKEITRGQIAKMVSNAANINDDPGAQIFEDVDANNPFYMWINRLARRGYMGGYSCGGEGEPCGADNKPYFRPYANATRGQLAKIVSNTAGIVGTPSGVFYTDVQPDNPFYLWIMRLTSLGVMSGYPCGGEGEPCDDQNRPYFRPYTNVTRGQVSKIVANTFLPGCQTPARP